MSSLQTKYRTEILPRLSEKLGGRNVHAVPKLQKVVISMGLNEQMVFPELNPDKVSFVQGMNIAVVTTAKNDEEGRQLLLELGFPFKKD